MSLFELSPVETAFLSGWIMLNIIMLVAAGIVWARVRWFESVLTSSAKLAGLRRDAATVYTILFVVLMCDILLLIGQP